MTEAQRVAAAEDIWGREKGIAATIIVLGWLSKVRSRAYIIIPCSPASHNKTSHLSHHTHPNIVLLRRPHLLLRTPPPPGNVPLAPAFPPDGSSVLHIHRRTRRTRRRLLRRGRRRLLLAQDRHHAPPPPHPPPPRQPASPAKRHPPPRLGRQLRRLRERAAPAAAHAWEPARPRYRRRGDGEQRRERQWERGERRGGGGR